MAGKRKGRAVEIAFRIGVVLKGLDGVLEILGAALLVLVTPRRIAGIVQALTQHELSQDPRDFVARHLLSAAGHLTAGGERFAALYLLVHGVVKVGLVAALLKTKLWAYPVAIAIFTAFGGYQIYRWTLSRSLAMAALTVLDAFVVALTWAEWRRLRRERPIEIRSSRA